MTKVTKYGRAWLWLAVFYTLPLLTVLFFSVMGSYRYPQFFPQKFGFDHWQMLGNAPYFRLSLWYSLLISGTVGLLSSLLGLFLSRLFYRSRFRDAYLQMVYLPYLLTPVIYAVLLQFFFIYGGAIGSWWGVGLAQLLITFPFAYLYFYAFWNPTYRRQDDLARNLGLDFWQRLRWYTWPYVRPAFFACFFQTFLISWFEFGLTSIIGVGKVKTLTVLVFQYLSEANIHLAAVSALTLLIPPLILLFLNRRSLLKMQYHES